MATAQTINYSTAAALQSPLLARKLTETTAQNSDKIVAIGNAGAKSRKAMLTTSAPRMNAAPSASPAAQAASDSKAAAEIKTGLTFLTMLAMYMASMNAVQIVLSTTQSSVNQAQFSVENNMVGLAQNQVTQAQKAYQEYEQELYEEQHQSFWQKFCGYFVAGLSMLLAGITGGLTAFLGAALITTLMMTGAMQKLDTAVLGSNAPSWATGLFNLGVAIVGTMLACAVTGVLTAAISSAASSGARTAAAAASEAAVQDGVNDEVDAVAQDIAAEDNAAAQNAIKNGEKGFLSKAYDAGFNTTSVLMNGTQFFSALNPLGDLITEALKKMGVSTEIAEIVGQIAGMILTVVGSVIAGRISYNSGNAGEVEDPLLKLLGEKLGMGKLVSLQIGMGLVGLGFSAASGGFQIEAGLTKIKEASTENDIGMANGALALYQGLLDILGPQIQAEIKGFSNLMNVYAQMTSNYNAFVQAGALAAEIL